MSNSLNIGGALSGAVDNMLSGSIAGNIQLDGGGSANLKSLSVFANGEYLPPEGYDGFDSVIVDVPSKEEVTGYITENGTHTPPEGKVYSGVEVAVPIPSPVLQSKSINENGTYTPPSGVDGFNEVVVNVPIFERHNELYYKTFIELSMSIIHGIYGDFQTTWNGGTSVGCSLNGTINIRNYHKLKVSGRITNSYEYINKSNLSRFQFVFGVTDQVFNNMIYVDYNTGDHIKGRNGITLTNTQDTGNFNLEIDLDEIESTNLYFFMSLLGITGTFVVELS